MLVNAQHTRPRMQIIFAAPVEGGFDLSWQPVTIGHLEKFWSPAIHDDCAVSKDAPLTNFDLSSKKRHHAFHPPSRVIC
ncbi:hypothetical protein RB2102 [Rhodopirellula baltica SH 1]|uniref:Uncharacterized protein n=1 Tax=Rhodopirellula baltica (strain DSM 10527 / NCIMB 13988 / SH1) TaxID=243090 RepID=Q7UWD7_RHOBA|nr:hypothetical protein RB2102 [Rhodopirellula baltica SH 1]